VLLVQRNLDGSVGFEQLDLLLSQHCIFMALTVFLVHAEEMVVEITFECMVCIG
jgi:hypothetical protein